jgi:hypothetical protein
MSLNEFTFAPSILFFMFITSFRVYLRLSFQNITLLGVTLARTAQSHI